MVLSSLSNLITFHDKAPTDKTRMWYSRLVRENMERLLDVLKFIKTFIYFNPFKVPCHGCNISNIQTKIFLTVNHMLYVNTWNPFKLNHEIFKYGVHGWFYRKEPTVSIDDALIYIYIYNLWWLYISLPSILKG